MGIETVLLLVEKSHLDFLLDMNVAELIESMEKKLLRDSRPNGDPKLNRSFNIDCEAEILDWFEDKDVDSSKSVKEALKIMTNGEEGVLKLMQWASPGQWDSWEARTYLYLDVALSREINNRDDLYSNSTWKDLKSSLTGIPEEEFAQKVCLDWMDRRKALGKTLDEKKDPKIIPTYEAHDRTSRLLVHAVTRWNKEENLVGIIGREHMEAEKWGHEECNIRTILHS